MKLKPVILLSLTVIGLTGCLGVDRIAVGQFTPNGSVRLYGSDGVGNWSDYGQEATVMFNAVGDTITIHLPSGSRIPMKIPSLDGLDSVEGLAKATGFSQNFDVHYKRAIQCEAAAAFFRQTYILKLVQRDSDQLLATFDGWGPKHKKVAGEPCPSL